MKVVEISVQDEIEDRKGVHFASPFFTRETSFSSLFRLAGLFTQFRLILNLLVCKCNMRLNSTPTTLSKFADFVLRKILTLDSDHLPNFQCLDI
jgi:hypothetical protein